MIDPDALAVTRLVTTTFDEMDVRYVIVGSLASMAHGLLRTTMDADIVADLFPEQVPALVEALSGAFYIPDELTLRQVIEHHGSFNLIHYDTLFKVDIFLPTGRPFDQQQLDRRTAERVGGESESFIWILSPEDVILAKLDWFRLGGGTSERQWRDVVGVIKAQSALDMDYLRQWASELDVADLLALALSEAD